jgi:hypothetical protein
MTSYLEMATVQEKAMCVLWFSETKFVIKSSAFSDPTVIFELPHYMSTSFLSSMHCAEA